jgi:dTDP-4-dehydrorhamnose 3,5-epimerase
MRVETTGIEGLAILSWEVSEDERGRFARTFCRAALAEAGLGFELVQANLSANAERHTLRGLHYQRSPHEEIKIVTCLAGRIWDVVVDVRPGSPTRGRWEAFELSPDEGRSLYVGEGLAHGFLTLEPATQVHYLVSAAYAPAARAGVRWDDPALAIPWPATPECISARDRALPVLGGRPFP